MARIIRSKALREKLGGVATATVWRWERAGRFPKRLQLGPNTVGWDEDAVDAWLEARSEGTAYQANGSDDDSKTGAA